METNFANTANNLMLDDTFLKGISRKRIGVSTDPSDILDKEDAATAYRIVLWINTEWHDITLCMIQNTILSTWKIRTALMLNGAFIPWIIIRYARYNNDSNEPVRRWLNVDIECDEFNGSVKYLQLEYDTVQNGIFIGKWPGVAVADEPRG